MLVPLISQTQSWQANHSFIRLLFLLSYFLWILFSPELSDKNRKEIVNNYFECDIVPRRSRTVQVFVAGSPRWPSGHRGAVAWDWSYAGTRLIRFVVLSGDSTRRPSCPAACCWWVSPPSCHLRLLRPFRGACNPLCATLGGTYKYIHCHVSWFLLFTLYWRYYYYYYFSLV